MIISSVDQALLSQYQVQVEIDTMNSCGLIIVQERCYKVTLLSRPTGREDIDWQSKILPEDQMKTIASKVAIMLLKKELLQEQQAEALEVQIHQRGITHLKNHQFISHEEGEADKNTRTDYNTLMEYVADIDNELNLIKDERLEEEEIEMKIVVEQGESLAPRLIPAVSSQKIETEQNPKQNIPENTKKNRYHKKYNPRHRQYARIE